MTRRYRGKSLYQFIAEHGELRDEQDCTKSQAMTYKLPEPDFVRLSDLQSGLDKSWSASSMQAAYEAGRRDMLERAIAKFEAEGDPFYAKPYINMLKELLK